MGWFKNITEKIFGKKTKMLEDGTNNRNTVININNSQLGRENFLKQYHDDNYAQRIQDYNPDINTPEGAIDQYLTAMLYRSMNNQNVNSYSTLITIGGLNDTNAPGNNLNNEKIVLENLKQNSYQSKEI